MQNVIIRHYVKPKFLNITAIGCGTIFWKKYEIHTVIRSLKGTYYETTWYGSIGCSTKLLSIFRVQGINSTIYTCNRSRIFGLRVWGQTFFIILDSRGQMKMDCVDLGHVILAKTWHFKLEKLTFLPFLEKKFSIFC